METQEMGRVLTDAVVESLSDLYAADRGLIPAEQVRRIAVNEALVDTGTTTLALPARMIRELGLKKSYQKQATCTKGICDVDVYEAVRLTIQGRYMSVDVMEVPDTVPVLIGQLPLEYLDFVVDPRSRRLIDNPTHGGEHIFELFAEQLFRE